MYKAQDDEMLDRRLAAHDESVESCVIGASKHAKGLLRLRDGRTVTKHDSELCGRLNAETLTEFSGSGATDCAGILIFPFPTSLFVSPFYCITLPLSLSHPGDLVGDGVQLNSTAFNSARVAITKTAKRSS